MTTIREIAPTAIHCTRCLKNVPLLACYNFDTRERLLTFFDRNTTDKASKQKTLYSATSNNVCFCITWQNGKLENCIFHLRYWCIVRIQSVAVWLLQYFWLTTHIHAAVWLSKSRNQCVQVGAFGWHGSRERKSTALQQLDCVACTKHQCAVFWVSSCAR